MELRMARSTDAETIVAWFPTRAAAILWGGPDVSNPLTSAWLVEQFAAGKYWVWVGSDGGVEGVFALVFPEDGKAHLARFAIAPKLRGQRLARGFVDEILGVARSLGTRRLSLGVYGSNRIARHLYDQAGFQLSGSRPAEEDPSGLSHQMTLDL